MPQTRQLSLLLLSTFLLFSQCVRADSYSRDSKYYRHYKSSDHSDHDSTAAIIFIIFVGGLFFLLIIGAAFWWWWPTDGYYCSSPYYRPGYCSLYGYPYRCSDPSCTTSGRSAQYSYHDPETGEHEQYQTQIRF